MHHQLQHTQSRSNNNNNAYILSHLITCSDLLEQKPVLGSTACPAVMVAVGRVCKLGLLLLALEMQSAPGRMALDQLDSACFNSGVSKRLGGVPASNPGAPTGGNGVPAAKNSPKKMALLATGLEKSPAKWVLD